MENSTTPLPTPRHLLTSLINTLTTPPQNPPTNEPYSASTNHTNPLKNLPPSHRALLTTLHVLFPTGMLLQALDLLDRGLVTHVIFSSSSSMGMENQQPSTDEPVVFPPQANIHLPPALRDVVQDTEKEGEASWKGKKNTIYKVTSSQPPKSRFSHSGVGGQVYTVRLEAWNCTCAAFAFSAFPSHTASNSKPWEELIQENDPTTDEGEEQKWEFGAQSFDGKAGEGIPVCKHLLACLLGDRWGDVVGGLVKEREVGRDEMGGLGAD